MNHHRNPDMTDDRDIEGLLRGEDPGAPAPELLELLRGEIPEHLGEQEHAEENVQAPAVVVPFSRPARRFLLAAAAMIMTAGASLLTYRLMSPEDFLHGKAEGEMSPAVTYSSDLEAAAAGPMAESTSESVPGSPPAPDSARVSELVPEPVAEHEAKRERRRRPAPKAKSIDVGGDVKLDQDMAEAEEVASAVVLHDAVRQAAKPGFENAGRFRLEVGDEESDVSSSRDDANQFFVDGASSVGDVDNAPVADRLAQLPKPAPSKDAPTRDLQVQDAPPDISRSKSSQAPVDQSAAGSEAESGFGVRAPSPAPLLNESRSAEGAGNAAAEGTTENVAEGSAESSELQIGDVEYEALLDEMIIEPRKAPEEAVKKAVRSSSRLLGQSRTEADASEPAAQEAPGRSESVARSSGARAGERQRARSLWHPESAWSDAFHELEVGRLEILDKARAEALRSVLVEYPLLQELGARVLDSWQMEKSQRRGEIEALTESLQALADSGYRDASRMAEMARLLADPAADSD